jgi:hypothetical protein
LQFRLQSQKTKVGTKITVKVKTSLNKIIKYKNYDLNKKNLFCKYKWKKIFHCFIKARWKILDLLHAVTYVLVINNIYARPRQFCWAIKILCKIFIWQKPKFVFVGFRRYAMLCIGLPEAWFLHCVCESKTIICFTSFQGQFEWKKSRFVVKFQYFFVYSW